jgi:hypothetical protein
MGRIADASGINTPASFRARPRPTSSLVVDGG